MKTGSIIDGKEHFDTGGGVFDVVNPATGMIIAKEACCDSAWIQRVVDSSGRAFNSSQ